MILIGANKLPRADFSWGYFSAHNKILKNCKCLGFLSYKQGGKREKLIGFIIVLVFIFSATVYASSISFMVLDMKGEAATKKQWDPLRNLLEEHIKQPVKLSSAKNKAFVNRAKGKDIILTNPVNAVILVDKGGCEISATLNHAKQGSSFAGVIIVRKDSDIKDLKDLARRKVAVVNKTVAAGGYLFQANELLNAGLSPEKDFKKFSEIFNQKAIVERVIKGQMDAGFVRTGMLEDLEKSHDTSQLRIINRMDKGLPYPRSTAIYPHWALLTSKKLSPDLKDAIVKTVLEIKADSAVAKSGKMKGFVAPLNYGSVMETMTQLGVYKFK